MSRFSIDRMSILRKNATATAVGSRQSMLFNEDDFDYALELRPDDEYR